MNFQTIFLDAAPKDNHLDVSTLYADNFLSSNIRDFHQPNSILISNRPTAELHNLLNSIDIKVIKPGGATRGALATALLAVDSLSEMDAIVLVPTNSHVDKRVFLEFIERMINFKYSAGTLCIKSDDPTFSYIRVYNGKVIEVIEKRIVGDLATTGIFFFKDKEILLESAKWAFVNNQTTNANFYIAPCLNYAISKGLEIGYFTADSKDYIHLH